MNMTFSDVVRYTDAQEALRVAVKAAIFNAAKVRSYFEPTVHERNNDSHAGSDARRCFECAYTLCVQGKYNQALAWFLLGSTMFVGEDEMHVIHATGRTEEGLHIQCNPDETDVWYVYYQSIAPTPWGNTEQRIELGNIVATELNTFDLHDKMQDIRYDEGGWFDLVRKEREERQAIRQMFADIYNEGE